MRRSTEGLRESFVSSRPKSEGSAAALAERPALVTDESTGASFEVAPGCSVLDAALEQGVALAHGCRHGVCGACAVEIVEGLEHAEARDPIEADSACRFRLDASTRLACRLRTTGPLRIRPA
jgi:ferredoxin